MRFSLLLLSIVAPIALATIISRDGPIQNTYNEMQVIIDSGNLDDCLPLAVIFARGTFDSGNVGYWVGPDFLEAFPSEKVARQGVDAGKYPANLKEYLQGGSGSGAKALATTVNAYLDLCTGAKVIISGWSQGALVAHLGLDLLDDNTVENNVAALVTFGDPYELFDMFHLRVRVDHFHSPCITGDLLCKPKEWDIAQILKDLTAFIKNIFNKLSNVKLHRQRYER